MTKFNRYLIIVSLLCLALVCYLVGFIMGIFIFIALGGLLELGFWIGVFTTKIETNSSDGRTTPTEG